MVKPRNLNLAVLRNDPNEIYEGTCLSTDTKPTNWPDNSILFELDTGTRYYSNSGTWYPVGGGADSGSGGGDVMMVSFTGTEAAPITDKTYAEVAEAIQNGQLVVFVDNISSPSEGAGIANKVVLGQDVAFQTTIPIIAHNSLSYLQLGIDPIGVAFYSRPLN